MYYTLRSYVLSPKIGPTIRGLLFLSGWSLKMPIFQYYLGSVIFVYQIILFEWENIVKAQYEAIR
jgi:hypothetical protein